MPQSNSVRPPSDRLRHAVLFEVIGLILVAPLASWMTGHGLAEIGLLTFIISLIAMAWNAVFNYAFDRIEIACGGHLSRRGWGTRVGHALLFEAGLALLTVPLIAWQLGMSWWEALLLDIGFIVFYLIYALIFNWLYDRTFPIEEAT